MRNAAEFIRGFGRGSGKLTNVQKLTLDVLADGVKQDVMLNKEQTDLLMIMLIELVREADSKNYSPYSFILQIATYVNSCS
ncbi:MAG: hypothetical protein HYV65_02350 [Candidatus Spechtbacteria bacterium]|nr:hypothetical protein [Candidatus Spechtbacteria bacterium]